MSRPDRPNRTASTSWRALYLALRREAQAAGLRVYCHRSSRGRPVERTRGWIRWRLARGTARAVNITIYATDDAEAAVSLAHELGHYRTNKSDVFFRAHRGDVGARLTLERDASGWGLARLAELGADLAQLDEAAARYRAWYKTYTDRLLSSEGERAAAQSRFASALLGILLRRREGAKK